MEDEMGSEVIDIDTNELMARIHAAGIDLASVTSAAPFLVTGKEERTVDPREILPGARAVIVTGFRVNYPSNASPSAPDRPRGLFPPYGSRVFMPMAAYCRKVVQGLLQEYGYKAVSSGKIPAKPAAVRAGLGHYGKNAVVDTPEFGSWVMFECLVTDAPLTYDNRPLGLTDCGDCTICLGACPTRAIHAPFKVDRARCITDWLWGTYAPAELREKQGNRLFGCGECLKACPRNVRVEPCHDYPAHLEATSDSPELIPLVTADDDYYRQVIPSFARLAGIEALRGNAIVALGNLADPVAVDALAGTLHYPRPQIRAYSAWSLGKDRRRPGARDSGKGCRGRGERQSGWGDQDCLGTGLE